MKSSDAKFFAAELGAKIPTVDLHGFYPDQAIDKLEIFLYQCVEKNIDSARIIYGGGTGRLRQAVLEHLEKHSVVRAWRDVGGSCVVLFS